MSKRSNQKTQPQKNQKSSSIGQELIIDSEDTYKDLDNISYIHPSHLNMIKSFNFKSIFKSFNKKYKCR